jgi:hypothetical protein
MRSFLAIALLSIVVAACGGTETVRPADTQPPGSVTVRVEQLYDMSKGMYVEGAFSYVRIEDANGNELVEKRLDDSEQADDLVPTSTTTLGLDPGTYRLVSYQRPCDGNCGYLDPPTDKCSREIVVDSGGPMTVTIRVQPGEGCTIETAG